MSLEVLLQATLLGAIEGLTEFIPVSSTGHLILLIDILKFAGPPGKVFEIIIQLGAIFAVCWLFRKKIWNLAITFPTNKTSRHFAYIILIAFLPAAIIGAMFHSYIKVALFNPTVVAISLIIGGIIIICIERIKPKAEIFTIDEISYPKSIALGIIQCLAMIPGTSRSGATIMGALLLKVDRKTATEFSFFLAIPTMLGATVYDIYKNYNLLSLDDITIILVGFFCAFITALLVVKYVIAFISRHGFSPFAYYRIVIGSIILFSLYLL
jgi:undecaprenyl-diphosphatase